MVSELLTSPLALRWFPWKLYAYVFGAAAFGWGVGVGMTAPSLASLVGLLVGCVLCVVGFVGMRPYMRASDEALREIASIRDETGSSQ